MKWYLAALKKYATFRGRASRKEFWMFVLFNFIFAFCAAIIDGILTVAIDNYSVSVDDPSLHVYFAFIFATLLPALAVTVRRLHDLGDSGWEVLLWFVPLANIYLIIHLCYKGEVGANRFGLDPNAVYNSNEPIDSL